MDQLYSTIKKTLIVNKNYVAFLLFTLISILPTKYSTAQNSSFNFDGINDYITSPVIMTGDYTKELWFKADAITGNPQNLLTGEGTAIYIDATGHLGGGNLTELLDPDPIIPGEWYHVAITFNQTNGALNLFKNGLLVDSKINATGYYEPYLQIGAYTSAYNFGGIIDEVRVWNIERTPTDIINTMNCEVSHRAPGLVAYYNFNEGTPGGDNSSLTYLRDVADNCIPLNGTFNNVALNGINSNFSSDVPASFTGPCVLEPIIRLAGVSGVCINNGDNTPSSSDGTDFGIAVESSTTNSFVIRNNGTQDLLITSIISNSLDFTPNFTVPVSIAPGDSYTFSITLNQSAIPGVKTATITIFNDDNTSYTFDVAGTSALKGQALSFDGQFSLVQTPVSLTGSYTKEAWINLSEIPSQAGNIITGSTSALYIDNSGNLGGGNLTEVSDPTGPIITGVWTHVAIVYDAVAGTVTLYKNGLPVDSEISNAFGGDGPQQIGAFNTAFFFKGLIDEVRIWSVARNATEILSSFSCHIPDDAPGLIAYYDFNQGIANLTNTNENILIDRTCSHNDGTLINFALTGSESNWVAPGAPVALNCEGIVPNIRVTGFNNCIAINETPSSSNGTDFGLYSAPGVDHTFTIFNTGSAALNILGASISGSGAAGFTILSGGGASTVQPGDSIKIVIRFAHTVNETIGATLTITNDDFNEGTYTIPLIGTGVGVVPVSLISFTGSLGNKVVNLNWNTTAEINNAGFEILRSDETGATWDKIGFVNSSGLENGSIYKFADLAPLEGSNYYRLKIMDNDGTYKLSNIVYVNNLTKSIIVKTYPNPFTDRFTLVFNDKELLNTKAKISSITGTKISDLIVNQYNQSIDLSKYPKGIYILTLSNGQSIKLIKN